LFFSGILDTLISFIIFIRYLYSYIRRSLHVHFIHLGQNESEYGNIRIFLISHDAIFSVSVVWVIPVIIFIDFEVNFLFSPALFECNIIEYKNHVRPLNISKTFYLIFCEENIYKQRKIYTHSSKITIWNMMILFYRPMKLINSYYNLIQYVLYFPSRSFKYHNNPNPIDCCCWHKNIGFLLP